MHDALARYEADTIVEDVDDWNPEPIALPRVATEDLTVHVMTDDGFWHRLHSSTVKTACGFPINYHRAVSRQDRAIEHPLATVRPDGVKCQCWTDEERNEADDAPRLAQKRRDELEQAAIERERIAQKKRDEFGALHERAKRDSERKPKP